MNNAGIIHPDLKAILESAYDSKVSIPVDKVYNEVFLIRFLSARVRTLENLFLENMAEKEGRDKKDIYYKYQGLQATFLADEIADFLGRYGR